MARRRKRSISKEYFVEALVVVDHSMVEYYKNEDINTYILTIMNMVSAGIPSPCCNSTDSSRHVLVS